MEYFVIWCCFILLGILAVVDFYKNCFPQKELTRAQIIRNIRAEPEGYKLIQRGYASRNG